MSLYDFNLLSLVNINIKSSTKQSSTSFGFRNNSSKVYVYYPVSMSKKLFYIH
jgi:hypothetical protein